MRSGNPPSRDADRGPAGSPGRGAARSRAAASYLPLLGLRYGVLLILGLVGAALALALLDGSRRPGALPLSDLETAAGVAQRSLNLDATRTRGGLPALRVAAREAFTYREGKTELHQVEVTLYGDSGDKTEVTAPLAISGEAGGGWSFRNGVVIRTEGDLVVRVPELEYSESPEEVTADGDVGFEQGELRGTARGLRYIVSSRRLEFLSQVEILSGPETGGFDRIRARSAAMEPDADLVTFTDYRATSASGEILEGKELRVFATEVDGRRRAERVEGAGGFVLRSPEQLAMPGILGSGGRSASGGSFTQLLEEDGQAGAFTGRGSVRVTLEQGSSSPKRLSSDLLEIDFVDGAAVAFTAEGEASFTMPRGGSGSVAPAAVLSAHTITASLEPASGEVSRLDASGDVRAEEDGRTFEATTMTYEKGGSFWVLRGTEDQPARASDESLSISARRVEIRREEEILDARGSVKTVTREAPGKASGAPAGGPGAGAQTGGAFFQGGEGSLHGISDAFHYERKGNIALYRGKARLWRAGQSIEAAEIDLKETEGVMEARRGVVARLPAKEQAGGGATPRIITVSSDTLRYLRETGEARFTGSVRAHAGDMRIEAESVTARSEGEGAGVRELQAERGVLLHQGSRVGDADRLVSDLEADRVVLYGVGRLATIQDQSTQRVVKGAVLTYEGAADRILVESETGGRTWITLNPRSGKGKAKSGPESPR